MRGVNAYGSRRLVLRAAEPNEFREPDQLLLVRDRSGQCSSAAVPKPRPLVALVDEQLPHLGNGPFASL